MRFTRLTPLSQLFRSASPDPAPAPEDPAAALASQADAVRELGDGATLRELAGLTSGPLDDASDASDATDASGLERIAQERMAQLIDSGAIDFSALCAPGSNTHALLAVAALCSDPKHLTKVVNLIDDPRVLSKLVMEGSTSRLRQAAAQGVQDPDELKQLLKQTRDRDKSAFKIIKQKCDALHAEEERIAQIKSNVATLCASLEQHAARSPYESYPDALERLEARWRTIELQAAAEFRQRADEAIVRCREVIAEHARQLGQAAAEKSQRAVMEAAEAEALALAEQETQRLNELATLAATEAAAEAAAARAAEEKARAEKLAAEALALRQLGGLIGKAQGALREGHTGGAAGLRRAIQEKLDAIPALPPHLAGQLQQLDAKLNELKLWKDYAVAPKRVELIAEMEALIGSSEEPKALADRIKQLQEDWKTISKGVIIDSEADWQRFHRAAETAYQPCRAYFEAQAQLRQANLDKRRHVIERLKAFEAAQGGENPDWRAVAAVLREAPLEWRRHFPVERAAGKQLQEEFDAAIGRIQGPLDAWQAGNAEAKKGLIQRAQAARGQDDREAVDALKRLQMQWKDIGPARRDQEQKLWEEFREHCDAVFRRREQALIEQGAALKANQLKAVALCSQCEQAAGLPGPELLAAAAQLPQWRADFEALGEFSKHEQRALRQRFERALKLCTAALSTMRQRERDQSFADLIEAARRIQDYGWAVSKDAAVSDRDALKVAAENFIAGVPHWPKGGAQALDAAWTQAHAAAAAGAEANEAALRILCIRNELRADLPMPPEDQELRRSYQMQRLVERMGQGREAGADDWETLALEWIRIGPMEGELRQSLLARFLRGR
jgi:Domain of Unknown Function (DUF349)